MIDRSSIGQAMSLRHMMDRMFEDAFVVPRSGGSEGWAGPAVDVYESDDALVVEAYVPGINPEAIDVQVERGVLTIRGQTEADQAASNRHYLLREHQTGRFTRSLQLPTSYTADPTEASYQHGILRMVFPKAEEAKPRRIQVSSGGGATALSNGHSESQTKNNKAVGTAS
jgi:HSP20 family protein